MDPPFPKPHFDDVCEIEVRAALRARDFRDHRCGQGRHRQIPRDGNSAEASNSQPTKRQESVMHSPYLFFEPRRRSAELLQEGARRQERDGHEVQGHARSASPARIPPAAKQGHAHELEGDSTIMDRRPLQRQCKVVKALAHLQLKDEAGSPEGLQGPERRRQVRMPLTKTFFPPAFRQLGDKFGLGWMVIVPQRM